MVIALPDTLHRVSTLEFAKKKVHILLEKPMGVSKQDCIDIASAGEANNIMIAVGHVLRYMPLYQTVKSIIDSGEFGQVVNIRHVENIGYYHFAHSYVRGNWRSEEESTFSLMAKVYIMCIECIFNRPL